MYEASGGVGGDSGKTDTILPGAMYTVQAVNNLIGGLITTLADHNMKLASARVADSNLTLSYGGNTTTTTLTVTNNCYGLNRAVKNAKGNFVARGRYNIEITNVVSDNSACTVDFSSKTVVPEKSASFTVTNGGFDKDTVVTYTVTYNIIDTNTNQALYTGLTCKTYQFVTPRKNWSDSVYPGGSQDSRFSNGSSGKTADGQATVNNTGYFGNAYLNQKPFRVSYPTDIVLASSNLDAVKNYKIRLGYDRTLAGSPDKTLDGVFAYSTGSVKDSFSNKTVTVNNSNMMAAFDKFTGDVLNYEKVDYTTDGGQTWVKGVAASQVPPTAYLV